MKEEFPLSEDKEANNIKQEKIIPPSDHEINIANKPKDELIKKVKKGKPCKNPNSLEVISSVKIDENNTQKDHDVIDLTKNAAIGDSIKDKNVVQEQIKHSSDLDQPKIQIIIDNLQNSLLVNNKTDKLIKKKNVEVNIKNSISDEVTSTIKKDDCNMHKNDDRVKSVINDLFGDSIKDKNAAQERIKPSSDLDQSKIQFISDDLPNSVSGNNTMDKLIEKTEESKSNQKYNSLKASPSTEITIARAKQICAQGGADSSKKSIKGNKKEKCSVPISNGLNNFLTSITQKITSTVQKFLPSNSNDPMNNIKESFIMSDSRTSNDCDSPNKNAINSSTFSNFQNLETLCKSKKQIKSSFDNYKPIKNFIWIHSKNFKEYLKLFKESYFISFHEDRQHDGMKDMPLPKKKISNKKKLKTLSTNLLQLKQPTRFAQIPEKQILGGIEFKIFCENYQSYFTEQREFAFTILPKYDYIFNGEIKEFDFLYDLIFGYQLPKNKLKFYFRPDETIIDKTIQNLLDLYHFPNIHYLDKFLQPPIDFLFFSDDNEQRRDFKDHFTFSLDHFSGIMMEDAFSYKKDIESNTEEFGLHTVDIEHVLKERPVEEAKAFLLSLAHYFPHRPVKRIFTENIVSKSSLRSAVNHFTLSTIIKCVNGEVVSLWIGKGIINSNISLSFNDAYKFLYKPDEKYVSADHEKAHQAILAFDKVTKIESTYISNCENDNDITMTDGNEISVQMFPVLSKILKFFQTQIEKDVFNKIKYPIPISDIFNCNFDNRLQIYNSFGSRSNVDVNCVYSKLTHFTSPLRSYSDIIIQKFIAIYENKDANIIIQDNFGLMIQLIFWTNIRLLQGYHIQKEADLIDLVGKLDNELNSDHLVKKNSSNCYTAVDKNLTFVFYKRERGRVKKLSQSSGENLYLRIQPLNHRSLDTFQICFIK